MSDVVIRPYEPGDRADLEAMYAALQQLEHEMRPARRVPDPAWTSHYVAELIDMAEGDGLIAVASEASGAVLGFIACYADENPFDTQPAELVIADVYVTPQARRRGVGRLLIAAARDRARCNGAARITVTALAVNQEAADTYATLGFAPMEVTYELPLVDPDDAITD